MACTESLPRRWVVKLSRTGAIYCHCAGLWHCEDFGCAILRAIGLLVFFRVVTFYTASTHLRRTCGGRRMTQMGQGTKSLRDSRLEAVASAHPRGR